MLEKRVRIKSQMPLWQFVLICLVLFAIVGGILYLLFNDDGTLSYRTRSDAWGAIWYTIFLIPLLLTLSISKKEYLSDIYITDDEIKLVYKIKNKITKTKVIKKNNINSFELNTDINVTGSGKYARTVVTYHFIVDLIEGRDIYVHDVSDITLVEGNYKFIYRILDAAPLIPNFKLNLNSNNDIIKAEIDYYKRFGKTIPFATRLKMEMNKVPLVCKLFLGFSITLMIIGISGMIYSLIPAGIGLSSLEKEYISRIESSYNYKKDYYNALYELDKAKNLISTDPYLYYCYARIYKKKKEYDTAILYAKHGISNLGNKEVYFKQYKYTKPRTDEYLYDILSDCYEKLEEWENAIEAYTNLANCTNGEHRNVYWHRGRMYFKLKKYDEAMRDFLKHRDIVTNYINTYHTENDKNAKYYNEHLIIINKWIESCDAWKRYETGD